MADEITAVLARGRPVATPARSPPGGRPERLRAAAHEPGARHRGGRIRRRRCRRGRNAASPSTSPASLPPARPPSRPSSSATATRRGRASSPPSRAAPTGPRRRASTSSPGPPRGADDRAGGGRRSRSASTRSSTTDLASSTCRAPSSTPIAGRARSSGSPARRAAPCRHVHHGRAQQIELTAPRCCRGRRHDRRDRREQPGFLVAYPCGGRRRWRERQLRGRRDHRRRGLRAHVCRPARSACVTSRHGRRRRPHGDPGGTPRRSSRLVPATPAARSTPATAPAAGAGARCGPDLRHARRPARSGCRHRHADDRRPVPPGLPHRLRLRHRPGTSTVNAVPGAVLANFVTTARPDGRPVRLQPLAHRRRVRHHRLVGRREAWRRHTRGAGTCGRGGGDHPDRARRHAALANQIFDGVARPLGPITVLGDSVLQGAVDVLAHDRRPARRPRVGPDPRGAGSATTRATSGGPFESHVSYWIKAWRAEGWDPVDVVINLGANDSGACSVECARASIERCRRRHRSGPPDLVADDHVRLGVPARSRRVEHRTRRVRRQPRRLQHLGLAGGDGRQRHHRRRQHPPRRSRVPAAVTADGHRHHRRTGAGLADRHGRHAAGCGRPGHRVRAAHEHPRGSTPGPPAGP